MSRDTCIMSVRVSDVSKLLIYIMVIGQVESNSVCNHTSDKQNWMTVKRESDLLITRMITDRIGGHEVLSPINQNYDKI